MKNVTDLSRKKLAKQFLFLFSDTGGGHRASALAIKGEMERLYGREALVDMVDVFVEMERWPFDRFPQWYPTVVGWNGIPWGMGYHLLDRVKLVKAMSRLVWPLARNALCDVIRQHPADVIVSLHPIPNYFLMMALRHLDLPTPVAIVALDMVTAHAGWFVPGAQRYIVPTEGAKSRARHWGVPAQQITVTGMPTRRAFVEAMTLSQEEARSQVGLPQESLVVLVVGGGEGMGPLAQVVRATAQQLGEERQTPGVQLVAIAGRNQALRRELQQLATPLSVQVEGFVSNMEVWMRAADLLVTKAGPNTLCEAFIAGLPLVLYTALPGQEEGNVTYVVENGAGVWAPQPRLAAQAVQRLLRDPAALQAMARRSQALARPQATEDIARQLWGLLPAQTWPAMWPVSRRPLPGLHLRE